MSTRSKRVVFHNKDKLELISPETLKLWHKYEIDMKLRELSPKTILGYENDLQAWWIFILDNQGNQSVVDIEEDDLVEFFYFCKEEGNNSKRMKRRMSSIAAFYKFLKKKKLIKENPMEYIDRPKKDIDINVQTYLSEEQVDLMRKKLKELTNEEGTIFKRHLILQLQTYAFFSLSTMARVTAISNTAWKQIDFDNRLVNEVVEKEGYVVTLYFSQEVKELLQNLQQFRIENNIEDKGYVFITSYDNVSVVTSSTLYQWCKKIGELINVPSLHPHDFRHSGSNLLKHKGMTLEDVSALLNHKSTDVTQKHYLRADTKQIQANKDKFEI